MIGVVSGIEVSGGPGSRHGRREDPDAISEQGCTGRLSHKSLSPEFLARCIRHKSSELRAVDDEEVSIKGVGAGEIIALKAEPKIPGRLNGAQLSIKAG